MIQKLRTTTKIGFDEIGNSLLLFDRTKNCLLPGSRDLSDDDRWRSSRTVVDNRAC